jgi:transposase-like protein
VITIDRNTQRWTIERKAAVVQAVRRGVLSLDEACRRYILSPEEFAAWERAIDRHGIHGLRVTRIQIYRDTE